MNATVRDRYAATASATVTAGGAVTLFLSGPRAWQMIDIGTVVVSSTRPANNTFPSCSVFRGAQTAQNLLGESRAADKVTFSGSVGDVLLPGDQLIVVVTNALPGTIATANLFGWTTTEART